MILSDGVPVTGVRKTADGYLVAVAKVARTGVQDYLGVEVGKPEVPIIRVYRPEESVFAKDAMNSYAHRPMTNDHPAGSVSSKNWRDVAIGNTGGEVIRDGDFVAVPLVIMDQAAIDAYESGKCELSMGLEAEIHFQDGFAPNGDKFDAYLGPMRMNHLALVDKARGGDKLRIGDRQAPSLLPDKPNGGHDMADALRKLLVDGLTIETTEQGAQAIEKLNKQLSDAGLNVKTLTDAHAVAMAAKDAELAKKDAAIDALKASVLTDAALDARVKQRADLISNARLIVDADYTGKSDAEIRKAVVLAKLSDAAVAGKADAYVDARFDILLEDASKDPMRQHMTAPERQSVQNVNDNGQAAYEARLQDAWKGPQPVKGV